MEKFVPFEKLSKRKRRELNLKKRGSWYGVNPVTKRSQNPKAYNRKKIRREADDFDSFVSFLYYIFIFISAWCKIKA